MCLLYIIKYNLHLQDNFPISKEIRGLTARKAPTASDGVTYLLKKLYCEQFQYLHRKTQAKSKNGSDLTVPMDGKELQEIRSKFFT